MNTLDGLIPVGMSKNVAGKLTPKILGRVWDPLEASLWAYIANHSILVMRVNPQEAGRSARAPRLVSAPVGRPIPTIAASCGSVS